MNENNHLGEISKTKHGTPIKIIEYNSMTDLTVECLDKYHYKIKTIYQNFKKGQIKNPYDKSVFGIGYVGQGIYKTGIGTSKQDRVYNIWCAMLERCYDERKRWKYPAYKDCVVCDEWLNYQNFAKWYYENYYQIDGVRVQIDKDILVEGNKVYSPDTCLFVPQAINMLFMKKSRKDALPTGIQKTNSNKYLASYNQKYLGIFNKIEDALSEYNKFKKIHISEIANKYKDVIPLNLYRILIEWDDNKISN